MMMNKNVIYMNACSVCKVMATMGPLTIKYITDTLDCSLPEVTPIGDVIHFLFLLYYDKNRKELH